MPIRKSELYSSLWQSCDELRGGMDASQYKDYVLMLLFVKYVSDKYAGQKYGAIKVPEGSSFADMVRLKGKSDIGDKINKEVVGPLATENSLVDVPDFNDATKLGSGKEMVDRLTNLIAIFESPALDFSKNRAGGDDILGDAYEYLMRHFATESGKSKGQFYTPSEVSRIIAKVIGISPKNTVAGTTAYDPTCGSGSLLLKVAAEAGKRITLEGQEKDVTTAGLARMNMILHDFPTAKIVAGNTLLTKAQKQERIDQVFMPYHNALKDLIKAKKEKFGYVLFLDLHSFTPVWRHKVRKVQIGSLAFDNNPLEPIVAEELRALCKDKKLKFVSHAPYRMDDYPPHKQYSSIQIEKYGALYTGLEVRNDLLRTPKKAKDIAKILEALIQSLLDQKDKSLFDPTYAE